MFLVLFIGDYSGFQITVEEPVAEYSLRPITKGPNIAMNQSEFLAITPKLLKAREISRVQGAIGFGFASHWLKNRRKIFQPITICSNRNRVITFDSHMQNTLTNGYYVYIQAGIC